MFPWLSPALFSMIADGLSANLGIVSTDSEGLIYLAGAVLSVALLAAGIDRLQRYRVSEVQSSSPKPESQPGRTHASLGALLDSSRRMTATLDVRRIREIAVADAISLTGAEAGAFLHHGPADSYFSETSSPKFFAETPSSSGLLTQVQQTPHSITTIVEADPAIVPRSAALAAAPVSVSGDVTGAIIVLRPTAEPFDDVDLEALDLLTAITGAALLAARTHTSAMRRSDFEGVTQLRNRRRLDRDLGDLEGGTTIGLAIIKVDHFEHFNGALDGPIAAETLRTVAATISGNVREADIVYSDGADEFSILMTDTTRSEALAVLERVRHSVETKPDSLVASRRTGGVTVSAGLALGRGATGELTERAGEALHVAMAGGHNRVAVAP